MLLSSIGGYPLTGGFVVGVSTPNHVSTEFQPPTQSSDLFLKFNSILTVTTAPLASARRRDP